MDGGHEIVNELEYCLALTEKEILSFDIMNEFDSDYAQWSHPGTGHCVRPCVGSGWDWLRATETGKFLPGAKCRDKMPVKEYTFQFSKRMISGIYQTTL